jgi:hypothetical protein
LGADIGGRKKDLLVAGKFSTIAVAIRSKKDKESLWLKKKRMLKRWHVMC